LKALITGAADGIGRALALRFARAGAEIVGLDVDGVRAEEARAALERAGARSTFHLADLADRPSVARSVEEISGDAPFDLVVHNAGINCVGRFEASDPAEQRRVVRVNLEAPMALTARLLEADSLAPRPSLVFVSSLSRFVGYPGAAVYAATKDGLASYARSLAVALAPRGGHVLTVFPGPTRTAHARRYSPDNGREAKRMDPDELADRVFEALRRRRRRLVPGSGNRLTALFGSLCPTLASRLMRRWILDALEEPSR